MEEAGTDGRLIITMPAYRAVRTLEKTVRAIPEGVADELILVDDASPDGTAELARELGLRVYVHAVNRGYGGNQKTCYTEALRHGASVVVMLHPDYQYEPEAVPLLVAPILAGRADMTFGSRFAGLGEPLAGGMPLYRYVGNRLTTFLENVMLGSRFTETHSGMRAYTRQALLSLPFLEYSDDFPFDSQLLVDAVTSGLRVVEVPIPTRYTKESSSIALGPSIRYVWSSLIYCFRRVSERGRRGARYPVARSRKRMNRVPRSGGDRRAHLERTAEEPTDRVSPNAPAWTLLPQEACGYVVRGSRVSVLTAGEPMQPEERPTIDVSVASWNGGWPDADALVRIADVIDEEGVLVVLLPHPTDVRAAHRVAESLSPALVAAGFGLVEARRGSGTGRGPSQRAVVIARLAAAM